MSKRTLMTLAMVVALVVAACGGDDNTDDTTGATATTGPQSTSAAPDPGDPLSGEDLDALVEAAKAEGEVVVYSFTSRIARVEEAFEEAYPEIDLVGFDISSTEQIERIKAEVEAGASGADVAYISDSPVVLRELVEPGLLDNWVPPQFTGLVPPQFQEPLLSNRLSTKVVLYNGETHPDGSPVSNLWELTQPEWTGKVVIVDPLIRGDYLDFMTQAVLESEAMAAAYEDLTGEPLELDSGIRNAGEQWIAELYGNGVVLTDDTDNVNAAVGALGQSDPPIGITSYSDTRDNEEEGWALTLANDVVPAPGIIFPAQLGIVKDAAHPAAARLVIHFMMGDNTDTGGPAYAPFYVPGDYATRTDITPHPDAIPLDEFRAWRLNPAAIIAERDAVADLILSISG